MLVSPSVAITVFRYTGYVSLQSQGKKGEVCGILHGAFVGDGVDILEYRMN